MKNVGIDIGKGYVKFFNEDNSGIYPSILGIGEVRNLDGEVVAGIMYENRKYTVGDKGLLCDVAWYLDDKKDNIMSLIFVLNTLCRYFPEHSEFKCGVGLPVGNYNAEKKSMKNKMSGVFSVVVDGKYRKDIKVDSYIIPEGLGAYYSAVRNTLQKETMTLVVDIGYKTVDTVLVKGFTVSEKVWGSVFLGIEKVVSMIEKALLDKYGVILPAERLRIAKIFENYPQMSSKIVLKTEEIDIRKEIDEAIETVAEDVIYHVRSIANENAVENVMFVGGGALLYKRILQETFTNSVFVEDVLANAKGFYYLLKKLEEKENKDG